MSNQQQSDTRTPNKGAPGNVPQHPDKSSQGGQQGSQKAGQDAQQKRDAHTNSSSSGSDDFRSGQHSSTKNLDTEPDRAGK